jgi:hypothetical protein
MFHLNIWVFFKTWFYILFSFSIVYSILLFYLFIYLFILLSCFDAMTKSIIQGIKCTYVFLIHQIITNVVTWTTDTDTSTPLIIWENDITKCNHKCWCLIPTRVRHGSVHGS